MKPIETEEKKESADGNLNQSDFKVPVDKPKVVRPVKSKISKKKIGNAHTIVIMKSK